MNPISSSSVGPSSDTGPSPSTISGPSQGVESTYHLKWINWNSVKIPIVMQSINGPCPLIAIMNVSLLREKIKLPDMLEQITANQLLTYLGECLMDSIPTDLQDDEGALLNLEQNIHDAIEVLPRLETGLDVNIRFTGITDFEYTQEYVIFDLLRIPLYHGWLSDPDLEELHSSIGKRSYNQLVDSIITGKNSTDPEVSARALIAEEFLEKTASQLTQHGLNELRSKIKDNEIGVLFRNNHFLTLLKRDGEIYTLVTDHGYLTEDKIIWESLDGIEGAGRFFNSNFEPSNTAQKQTVAEEGGPYSQKIEDYLQTYTDYGQDAIAAEISQEDHELAKRLQAEEEELYDKMLREQYADECQSQNAPIGHFNDIKDRAIALSNVNPEPSLDKLDWPTLKSANAGQEAESKTGEQKITSSTTPIVGDSRSNSSELAQEFQMPKDLDNGLREAHSRSYIAPKTDTTGPQLSNQSGSRHSIPSQSSRRPRQQEKNSKESNCLVS